MKKLALLALMLTLSMGAWGQNGNDDNGDGNGNGHGQGQGQRTPDEIAAAEVKFLTALLDLTPAQQATATKLFSDEEKLKQPLETDLDNQQAALKTALLATPTGDITTPVNKIGADTIALETLEVNTELAFYNSLTTEQKTKYANFLKGDFLVPGHGPGNGHGPGGNNGHGH